MFGAGLALGQDSRSTKEHRVAQEKSKKHARAKKEHKKKKEKTTQPEDNYNLLVFWMSNRWNRPGIGPIHGAQPY